MIFKVPSSPNHSGILEFYILALPAVLGVCVSTGHPNPLIISHNEWLHPRESITAVFSPFSRWRSPGWTHSSELQPLRMQIPTGAGITLPRMAGVEKQHWLKNVQHWLKNNSKLLPFEGKLALGGCRETGGLCPDGPQAQISWSHPHLSTMDRCSSQRAEKGDLGEHNQKNSSVEGVVTFYLPLRHLRCPEKLQHIWEPVVLGEGGDG